MHHRLIAIFALLSIALGGSGCASKSRSNRYEEVLMPLQTGSTLQRRVIVERTADVKKKRQEKKKRQPAKPETEPAETPPTSEEEAPPPERFR
jgi:hypothetical protein